MSSDGPQAHGNSVEGSRQQGEIRLGEFLSPPEQAHDDKEISIGKKSSFDTATEYGTVATIPTEKTRTTKSAVRACLETARRDSRLGYQWETDYIYTPEVIEEKLKLLRLTLDHQIPASRR
jgi:hypothetical protein